MNPYSLYIPFPFSFRFCVGDIDRVVEARREGPKPLTNATKFPK
jgi:hypothetical protein